MASFATIEELKEVQRKMTERITLMEQAIHTMFTAVTHLFGDNVPAKLKDFAKAFEENDGDVVVKPPVRKNFLSLIAMSDWLIFS